MITGPAIGTLFWSAILIVVWTSLTYDNLLNLRQNRIMSAHDRLMRATVALCAWWAVIILTTMSAYVWNQPPHHHWTLFIFGISVLRAMLFITGVWLIWNRNRSR